MTEWLLVLAGVGLTIGTAVFVAAEFAFVALDKTTVQTAIEEGDTAAKPVLASLSQLSTQLSASQVGITLTTLVLGYIAEPSIGKLLRTPLSAVGVPQSGVQATATAVALVIATLFSMLFGELLPQFLGISAPLRTAKLVARPVRVFSVITKPLIIVLNGSANLVLKAFRITPREELSAARTPQELASLVRRSAEAGTMDQDTARLLTRSLDFGDRTAADVMTPRVRCTSIERTVASEDIVRLARRTGHSRFPVTGDDWDDVDGLVHVKRAIAVPHQRRADVPVSALMVDALMVPETIRLDPLLLMLRHAKHQMAVVVDEYGGTSGLVTLEDVIEEIVGEVSDEHDRSRTTGRISNDGSWMVPGLWRPDEVRDRLGAPVPDGSAYETIGGYVMAVLGRVPVVGDEISVPGWSIAVHALEGRRVDRLRFTPISEESEESDDDSTEKTPGAEPR
ncbi:MAG: magnesium and cobalt exporter, family [Actinomycetota bacterium]|jgi:CBS domain containing-hemolysin-like protein|nr:magnesium and cobalt exporter, family [Actinomycetota bacterium]